MNDEVLFQLGDYEVVKWSSKYILKDVISKRYISMFNDFDNAIAVAKIIVRDEEGAENAVE